MFDKLRQAKEKAVEIPSQTVIAVKMIAGEIIDLYFAHPKFMLALTIFQVWCWSLVFQHLTELKSLWQLIPFFGS